MTKTTEKAAGLYGAARDNEYVNRLIEDKELRESLVEALQASKKAYARVADHKKGPVTAVTNDRKVQRDLRNAAESLREASEQMRTPKKRKRRLRKLVLLVLLAAGVTLAVSEDARKAVLDALFGPEEEFEYTSPTGDNGGASV